VHQPCLDADICEGGQVGLDQIGEDVFLFAIAQLRVGKPGTRKVRDGVGSSRGDKRATYLPS
jgi:hypothetical protein